MQRNAHNGGAAADSDLPLTMVRRRAQTALTDGGPQQHALIDARSPSLAALTDAHSATDSSSVGARVEWHDAHTASGIATPIGKPDVESDVDRLLDAGLGVPPPPAKKLKPAAAVAAVMKKPARATSATAAAIFDRSSPPKFGTECPCVFNGCRIYEVPTKFRVVPAPDLSVYDKAFTFNAATKKTAWESLIKYCRNPSIPKDSKNYVKIGK